MQRRTFLSTGVAAFAVLQKSAKGQEAEYPNDIPVLTAQQAKHVDPKFLDIRNQIAFDRYGLIIQRNGDGGDTAAREGMYWLARAGREKFGFYNAPGKPKLAPFQPWRTRSQSQLPHVSRHGHYRLPAAAHESPRTTKLYDRTSDEITLDEIERIGI